MTNSSTKHPQHIPYIELTDEGRKISFRKDCLDEVEIYRKVDENERELLIKNIRTPYIDQEEFPAGTQLSYSIRLVSSGEEKPYELDVRL